MLVSCAYSQPPADAVCLGGIIWEIKTRFIILDSISRCDLHLHVKVPLLYFFPEMKSRRFLFFLGEITLFLFL